MQVKLTGTIHTIGKTQEIPTKKGDTFYKREVIIEEIDGKYPQAFTIEFTQDKVDLINSFNVGDRLEVNCNINGRIYNGKCYNSFSVWKIENQKQESYQSEPVPPMPIPPYDEATDELPF